MAASCALPLMDRLLEAIYEGGTRLRCDITDLLVGRAFWQTWV
jgi:hypothetical protein